MRKPNRNSVNVYHARGPEPARLQRFMRIPAVKEALLRLREERRRILQAEPASLPCTPSAIDTEPQAEDHPATDTTTADTSERLPVRVVVKLPLASVLESDDDIPRVLPRGLQRQPIEWPEDVTRINEQLNPNGVQFEVLDDLGECQ